MKYSNGAQHKFLLNNRKKLITKLIKFSVKLKNNPSEYDEFCSQIKRLNQCDVTATGLKGYITTKNNVILSSADWSELEEAIKHEEILSYSRLRNEVRFKLNIIYLQSFASIMIPLLVAGGIITLCILIDPIAALTLFALPLFFAIPFNVIDYLKSDWDNLSKALAENKFESDYAVGLAFDPNQLRNMLDDNETNMKPMTWLNRGYEQVTRVEPSAPLDEAVAVPVAVPVYAANP